MTIINNMRQDPDDDFIVLVRDTNGDEHELCTLIDNDGARLVYFDDAPFDPAAARGIARYLTGAAEALEGKGRGRLVAIPGADT